jgi:hypothetical protein
LNFSISCLFPLLFLFPLLMSIPITATLWTVHWLMFELTHTHWWELVKSVGCYGRWSVYAMYVAAEAPRTCVWLSRSFKTRGLVFFFFFFFHSWVSSFSCLLIDLVAVMISQSLVTLFSGDLSILLQLIQLIKYLRNSQYLWRYLLTSFKPWTFMDVVVELDRLCFKVELYALSKVCLKSLHLIFVCDTLFYHRWDTKECP